jgi:hypothetical protein
MGCRSAADATRPSRFEVSCAEPSTANHRLGHRTRLLEAGGSMAKPPQKVFWGG